MPGMTSMRIRLDRTICDGFGVCAARAPGYFSLDDWGYASLSGDGQVAPEDEAAVHRAILDCPVHAVTVLREPPWSEESRLRRAVARQGVHQQVSVLLEHPDLPDQPVAEGEQFDDVDRRRAA